MNIQEGVGEIKRVDLKAGLWIFTVHDVVSGRTVKVTKEGLLAPPHTTPSRRGDPVQEDAVKLKRDIVHLKGRLESKNQEVGRLQDLVSTLSSELESAHARAEALEARSVVRLREFFFHCIL